MSLLDGGLEHFNDSDYKALKLFLLDIALFLAVVQVVELVEQFVGLFLTGRDQFCLHGNVHQDLHSCTPT